MSRRLAVLPVGPIPVVLAVLALALLGPVPKAVAHDAVTGTSPADGQTLEAAPEAIEITFTDPPLSVGSEILIEDAQGTNQASGDVEITGNTATQSLNPQAPAGLYTVTWRVVSSDSHPIEGSFGFAVDEASASDSPAGPVQTPSATPMPAQAPEAEQQDDAGSPTGFLVALGLVLLALILVIVTLVASRGRQKAAGGK